MQRANRSRFRQKGAEVQKIDQGGAWAYIESSYVNPDFEVLCGKVGKKDGQGSVMSVAKWVYRCKRLLRKSGHVVVSLNNGEILEPCYFIEPSSEKRFPNKTLVWLEPLPQLNGYVFIPGGTTECKGYGYYYYGSGSGLGYGSGSGSGLGGYGYGSGSGSGIGDCASLLNCLCVKKDSQGKVIGVYIKNTNGSLTEIGECPAGSGSGPGSGSGGEICCPTAGVDYVLDYNITVLGNAYSGTTAPNWWAIPCIWGAAEMLSGPPCGSEMQPPFMYFNALINNGTISISVTLICGSWSCTTSPTDFSVSVSGNCPGTPTFYITALPSNQCLSGTFTLRPA
jgi:hypothetical protein